MNAPPSPPEPPFQSPPEPPPGPHGKPPAQPAEPATVSITLRPLGLADPLRWLALGWRDFRRCPGIGLCCGACFMAMGWLLTAVFKHAPAYVLALSAGFLLTGPFFCLGLYQASLRLVLSQPVVMLCWGALITTSVVLAMLPWFAGLLVAGPVLGHASWHAYRAAVAD